MCMILSTLFAERYNVYVPEVISFLLSERGHNCSCTSHKCWFTKKFTFFKRNCWHQSRYEFICETRCKGTKLSRKMYEQWHIKYIKWLIKNSAHSSQRKAIFKRNAQKLIWLFVKEIRYVTSKSQEANKPVKRNKGILQEKNNTKPFFYTCTKTTDIL